ncbi:hypothetical protein [Herbidospora cretacea]|uniref:hypothetical protein n=1 Tax=Herbidospora cretacea TaxID=28444 RepID=UPI000A8330DE|nr:hypothetical protein [Herbidospora cretacea]
MNELPPSAYKRRPPTKPFGRFLWGRHSLFRRTVTLALAVGFGVGFGYSLGVIVQAEEPARPALAVAPVPAAQSTPPAPVALRVASVSVPHVPLVDKSAASAKPTEKRRTPLVRVSKKVKGPAAAKRHRSVRHHPCARFDGYKAQVCKTLFKR